MSVESEVERLNLNMNDITRQAALEAVNIWEDLPEGLDDMFLSGVIASLAALTGDTEDKGEIAERLAGLVGNAFRMMGSATVVIEDPL